MRIMFLQPSGDTLRGLPAPPYAVMYVAAVARQMGHEVKILDRNIEYNSRRKILDFQPEMFCITSLTGPMILDALKVAEFVRCAFPSVPIVWGGIHCSIFPAETLAHELVDFIIIGEGERTFRDFLETCERRGDFSGVPGLGYKKAGRPVINERRPFMKDLEEVPLAPWDLIDYPQYLKYETLFITSRGCPHRCSFCYNEQYYHRTWRGMSPERVQAEIANAQKYHPIRRYRFDDDNFTVDKKRLYRILDFIPADASLYLETRIDYVDEEFCRRLAGYRDAFVFLGIESGDEEMLKRHQKDITLEKIRAGFALLHKYKIKMTASFVIGAPGETREQINKTIALAEELRPTRYTFCIFTPFPGALYYDELAARNPEALPRTLEEWGRFSTSERALLNYSQVSAEYLDKIYRRYWRKTVYSFFTSGRWNWLWIGWLNALRIYRKKMLMLVYRDI